MPLVSSKVPVSIGFWISSYDIIFFDLKYLWIPEAFLGLAFSIEMHLQRMAFQDVVDFIDLVNASL